MRRAWTLVLPVAMLLAVSGCAASNGSAAGTAETYLHDLGDGDFRGACTLLTDELRGKLGDCPAALRGRVSGLPVGERTELRGVRVRHVVYHGSAEAQVYPQDVKTDGTVTVTVKGSPAPRSTTVRSIAAYHATNGNALRLTKDGHVWLIADGV